MKQTVSEHHWRTRSRTWHCFHGVAWTLSHHRECSRTTVQILDLFVSTQAHTSRLIFSINNRNSTAYTFDNFCSYSWSSAIWEKGAFVLGNYAHSAYGDSDFCKLLWEESFLFDQFPELPVHNIWMNLQMSVSVLMMLIDLLLNCIYCFHDWKYF